MTVDFFFGPGSRYSYLASTQLDRLSAETGARFRWRVALSGDLSKRVGNASLASRQGQYTADYRLQDVQRWADLYSVPFVDVDPATVNWDRVKLACVAADILGGGEAFARAVLHRCHALGAPVDDPAGLTRLAQEADLDGPNLLKTMVSSAADARYEANLADAARAGSFGVPSFVTDDGQLFWGQDRLPLLRRHLESRR